MEITVNDTYGIWFVDKTDKQIMESELVGKRTNKGILKITGKAKQGGGHGEGNWESNTYAFITENYDLIPLKGGDKFKLL